MISLRKNEPDILKGVIAGLIAGAAATWVKNKVQNKVNETLREHASPGEPLTSSSNEESSTGKVAEVVSKRVLGRELKEEEKDRAGTTVDFSFGSVMGGFYGGVSEVLPEVRAGEGLVFGTVLWAFGDEIGVPAAGLAKWPQEYPISVHANALAGHLVYGVALEVLRRFIRRTLD